MALGSLIKKNFKLLVRAKSSSLIVILGPLLIIFLVGVAFDNANTYSLQIGVYSDAYSELSESFIDALKQQEFSVQKMASQELCVTKIKEGNLHTCIIFPPNMEITNAEQNEIQFHVDYSRINLVWMVLDTISAKIHSRSSEISEDLAQILLQKLDETRVEIINKNPVVESLKTQNSELVTKMSSIKGKLEEMDLTLDKQALGFTNLQSAVEANANETADIGDTVATLEDKIVDLDDLLDEINVSSANNLLEQIYVELNALKNVSEGNQSWEYVNSLVNTVNSQLDATKSKLDSAKEKKGAIDSDIGTASSSLTDTQNKIEEIQLALQKIDASISGIEVTQASTIASPIKTSINPVTPNKTHLNYLFPSLLVLVIMFISVILSATLVMMEKNSPAYFRNLITPVRNFTFIFSIYLTNLIIVMLQLVVIFLISVYFFNAQLLVPNLWVTAIILFLGTSLFTALGMFIGYAFKSEETSTLASISISSVLLLLSNMIIPLESMPQYLLNVVRYNPFVITESLIKRSVLFNVPIENMQYDIYFLVGYFVLLFVLILIITKFAQGEYFHKMGYKIRKSIKTRRAKKQAAKKAAPVKPAKVVKKKK